MSKKIFLAGATGAIGQVLSRLLVADGWDVYGTTRSDNKVALLQEMGVKPVVVDVYDAEQLKKIVKDDSFFGSSDTEKTIARNILRNRVIKLWLN